MKKTMKIAALLLCAVMMTCLMVGCDETTRMKEENYTENTKTQILDMYGLPEVSNFFEYSQLKEIYELRDNPMLYRTLKRMIERGQTEGIEKRLDVFYAAGKLTDDEYSELIGMLK